MPSKPKKPNKPKKPSKPNKTNAEVATELIALADDLGGAEAVTILDADAATGEEILARAAKHTGEEYILGARAPMANGKYTGPWDCAEFCSWCVYQESGVLFGAKPANDPVLADAFTGYWAEHSGAFDCRIPVEDAISIAGACLLRLATPNLGGHIAFSDGTGSTIEARGKNFGVGKFKAIGRRWDYGILVPGVRYHRSDGPVEIAPQPHVLRVTSPLMRGPKVQAVQKKLKNLGFNVGDIDGIFGGQTASAVIEFQNSKGLNPDGEVGPDTLKALDL